MLHESIDLEVSARYLALSVDAQRVADELAQPAQPDRLRDALASWIESLKSLEANDARGTRRLQPLEDYEQLSTLYDVLGAAIPNKLQQLRSDLQALMESRGKPSGQRTKLIALFNGLSQEALRRSRQPAEGLSQKALELCRQV